MCNFSEIVLLFQNQVTQLLIKGAQSKVALRAAGLNIINPFICHDPDTLNRGAIRNKYWSRLPLPEANIAIEATENALLGALNKDNKKGVVSTTDMIRTLFVVLDFRYRLFAHYIKSTGESHNLHCRWVFGPLHSETSKHHRRLLYQYIHQGSIVPNEYPVGGATIALGRCACHRRRIILHCRFQNRRGNEPRICTLFDGVSSLAFY